MPKKPAPPPPMQDPLLQGVPSIEGYKVLGKTIVLERLGQGGMGVVYRGFHLQFGIEVAVKVLQRSFAADRDFITAFLREAQASLLITHQNVVRAYDVEERHGLLFLVMEFVDGETAWQRVGRLGRMSPREALAAVTGVAAGLAEAHREGLVHRDIKPGNLMIGRSGRVKLADLGLVHPAIEADDGEDAEDAEPGREGMGTPRYMAPECWSGVAPHPTADVWALGATLYYLVTGNHAVPRMTARETRRYVRDNPLPTLFAPLRELPALDAVYERCVHRDPRERFQNAEELHAALTAIGPADESLLRRPPPADAPPRAELPPDDVMDRIEAGRGRPAPVAEVEPRRPRPRRRAGAGGMIRTLIAVGVVAACVAMYQQMREREDAARTAKTAGATNPTASSSTTVADAARAAAPAKVDAPVRADLRIDLAFVTHDGRIRGVAAGTQRVEASLAGKPLSPAKVAVDGAFEITLGEELPLKNETLDRKLEVVAFDERNNVSPPQTTTLRALVRAPVVEWKEPPIGVERTGALRVEVEIDSLVTVDEVWIQGKRIAAPMLPARGPRSRWADTVTVPAGGLVVVVRAMAAGIPGDLQSLPLGVRLVDARIETSNRITMVPVAAGRFILNSKGIEVDAFWLAETEVSRAQWTSMGFALPEGAGAGPDLPIANVTVEQAARFCDELTKLEDRAGRLPRGFQYRLPSDVRWRFACRADAADKKVLPLADAPRPVREGAETSGLRFMHGNVAEWCIGPSNLENYVTSGLTPVARGELGADSRSAVALGASWCDFRDAHDFAETLPASGKRKRIGFRVALVPVVK